ncbi:MAG: PH domain-containing protein [Actinomycetota bacterium]
MRAARYLATDEHLVLEARRHIAVLARPLGAAVVAIAGGAVIGFVLSPDRSSDVVDTVLGLIAVFFFLRLGWKLWEWYEDRIYVTSHRVVEVSGVITRRVASIPLIKVTDMTYQRSLIGRMIGFGELILESAGQRQALERIDHIPSPDDFYRTVTSLIAARAPAPLELEAQTARRADEDDTGPLPRVVV